LRYYWRWWWGKDNSALRASPFGSLPEATLSRWRSNRTLVEASHPSPFGEVCGYVGFIDYGEI